MSSETKKLGYDDTPILPGTNWRVHDGDRPQPRLVTPAAQCSGAPSDAVVLFDGSSLDNWISKSSGGPAEWKIVDDYMEVVPGTGYIATKEHFGSCQLHLEFACPEVVKGEGQGRGNSGVFMMGLYEVQVLDCYNNLTYPDGTTGALYGQCPPLVNACRPPGEWQSYDIIWEAPVYADEKLVTPAFITVLFNGVLLHHRRQLAGQTKHLVLPECQPHPAAGPLELQDHGDLVRFRNIWYRPLRGYDEG